MKKTASQIADEVIAKYALDDMATGAAVGSLVGSGAGVGAGHIQGLSRTREGQEVARRIGLDTSKEGLRPFLNAAKKLKNKKEVTALLSLLRRKVTPGIVPAIHKISPMSAVRMKGGVKGGLAGLGLGLVAGGVSKGLSE